MLEEEVAELKRQVRKLKFNNSILKKHSFTKQEKQAEKEDSEPMSQSLLAENYCL